MPTWYCEEKSRFLNRYAHVCVFAVSVHRGIRDGFWKSASVRRGGAFSLYGVFEAELPSSQQSQVSNRKRRDYPIGGDLKKQPFQNTLLQLTVYEILRRGESLSRTRVTRDPSADVGKSRYRMEAGFLTDLNVVQRFKRLSV